HPSGSAPSEILTPDTPSSSSSLRTADPFSAASYSHRGTKTTTSTVTPRLCRPTCTHCPYRRAGHTYLRYPPHPGASDLCSTYPRRSADLSATRPGGQKRHRFFETPRSQPRVLHRQREPASIRQTIHWSNPSSRRKPPDDRATCPCGAHSGSTRWSSCLQL